MKTLLLAILLATGINIIPQPQCVTPENGTFKLKGTHIVCDAGISPRVQEALADFSASLTMTAGQVCPVSKPLGVRKSVDEGTAKGIVLTVDPTMKNEAYSIRITPKVAVLEASDDNGFLYAIQTLKQLLPVEIFGNKPAEDAKWEMPCCIIRDMPRFAYRGMHLDCGRHFFTTDEIKKVLDMMATCKLNRFHWHLTEDQGWRAEIKAYPRLTEVGAWRKETIIGYQPAQKAEDFKFDGTRHGGFYTQEEMRDIVDYAWKLGITVVPEVDLPGHMLAALAAYPELGCTGGPYEVWPIWGVSKQVLCPGKEETMKFLETVLGELADIFPGEYFHIGGDECPKDEWKESPECQALIKELGLKTDARATAEQRLQNYVTSRMQAFLATKGKKIIGWDEILEGDLAEGATVMSWRGTKGGVEASNRGFDVIMTPTDYCYFDYCQAPGGWQNSGEPLCAYWGTLTLKDVYGFNPTAGLNEKAAKHILGAQANVWTEYIPSDGQLEYMIMPRLFAMSAVQWCNLESKPDYDTFFKTVREKGYPMLDMMGFNYRKY